MSEAYRKVNTSKEEPLPSNEIRVRRDVGIGRYLRRAWELLNDKEDTVVIKGVANAVQSVVSLAELIKHRIKGLHQVSKIDNLTIVDEYEPKYEGLDRLKFTRVVTYLSITLTKSNTVDTKDPGYQAPIDASEVTEYTANRETPRGERRPNNGFRGRGRGGRGRGGRGGRGGEGPYRGGRRNYDRDTEPRDSHRGRKDEHHTEGEERRERP